MNERDQYGFKSAGIPKMASANAASAVTPRNMMKRPPSNTLHETLNKAGQASGTSRTSSARPVSFSRRPSQAARPAAATVPPKDASFKPQPAKPQKQRSGGSSQWTGKVFDFIDRYYKAIGAVIVSVASVFALHSYNESNADKRARMNNEPVATLTPQSDYEAAVEVARNLVPSPDKQMKNGLNTTLKNWKGSISEITGGADINTYTTKDGRRPDKSYIVTGKFAGTTGPSLGNTLVHGRGNLEKKTYHDKTINTEDQARLLEVVNLNERISDLPPAAYQKSPTEARLDTSKRDKAAAQKAAAERAAAQRAAVAKARSGNGK